MEGEGWDRERMDLVVGSEGGVDRGVVGDLGKDSFLLGNGEEGRECPKDPQVAEGGDLEAALAAVVVEDTEHKSPCMIPIEALFLEIPFAQHISGSVTHAQICSVDTAVAFKTPRTVSRNQCLTQSCSIDALIPWSQSIRFPHMYSANTISVPSPPTLPMDPLAACLSVCIFPKHHQPNPFSRSLGHSHPVYKQAIPTTPELQPHK